MISGLRDRRIMSCPPTMLRIAAVAMVVRGHKALTATRPRNSSASPRLARLIAAIATEADDGAMRVELVAAWSERAR